MKPIFQNPDEALADLFDGATILAGGFALFGTPTALIEAVLRSGKRELTFVSNGARAIDALVAAGQVKKFMGSFPIPAGPPLALEEKFRSGEIVVEITPQGSFAERIRAGGAGIPAFYTPTGVGTIAAEGKEIRLFGEREYILEQAVRGDFALIRAHRADTMGNLVYRRAARNFNPVMAAAAEVTVVEVPEVVEAGELDPEAIVTPGIYVDRIVLVPT